MWVVTCHDGGGSMVEAASPLFAFHVSDRATAIALEKSISKALEKSGDTHLITECWVQVFELKAPMSADDVIDHWYDDY